ncbi:hypothetical protein FVEN_g3773 [Fusarium venenatum]|nr:hypothetical protein FVEN_g3773 [Fusarium venenatum]
MSNYLPPRLSCLLCKGKKQSCDRALPKCSRCSRQGYDCSYPDKRKPTTGRRKQARDLETKLMLLEARIDKCYPQDGHASGSEMKPGAGEGLLSQSPGTYLVVDDESPLPHNDQQDSSTTDGALHLQLNKPTTVDSIIGNPIPTPEMLNLYFEKLHHATPMIHRSRYEECVGSSGADHPPKCLHYIICALGADCIPTYQSLSTPLYRQARVFAEADEMDDEGKSSFDLAHLQTWLLVANFEARKGLFSRAAISLARSIRMAQMLNLNRDERNDTENLPPRGFGSRQDWIILEECRRTWWCLYVSDRLLFVTSGLPSVIDSTQVQVSLPASEQAFESGCPEETATLQGALHHQDRACSVLALRVIAASLFYRAVRISDSKRTDEEYSNANDKAYWECHKVIKNDLITLQTAFSRSFRLPDGLKCQQSVFVYVLIQMTILSLYNSTMQIVHGGNERSQSDLATESCEYIGDAVSNIVEVFKSMRNDADVALNNPILNYAAYTAALLLLSGVGIGKDEASKVSDAIYLQQHLQQAGVTQPIAYSLGQQLKEKLAGRAG